MAADAPAMRRGEDFLGRNVGVAGDAIPGGRGAAFPFVAVGKTDRQIRAGAGIFQCVEALAVQPLGPLAQHGVVLFPCGDGAIKYCEVNESVDARGGVTILELIQ